MYWKDVMANYFVSSVKGKDTNSGLSWALAFKTIEKAGTLVDGDDTIYIATNEIHEPMGVSGLLTDGDSLIALRRNADTDEVTTDCAIIRASEAQAELIAIDIVSDGKITFKNIEFDGNDLVALPYNDTLLGATSDNNITVENCRFTNLERVQSASISDDYVVGVYSDCIFDDCSIEAFLLSQCSITIEDCIFKISNNPTTSILNIKNGSNVDQIFTRCVFYYSGDSDDRDFRSSIRVDGRAAGNLVQFDDCTFDTIHSVISTTANQCSIDFTDCRFMDCFSRYLSENTADPPQDVTATMSDSYWYNSPDYDNFPGEIIHTRTMITEGDNVINTMPPLSGGECIPFENTEVNVTRYLAGYLDINNKWVEGYPSRWVAQTCSQPLSGREAETLIEGRRINQGRRLYTCQELKTSDSQNKKNGDKITIGDDTYFVVKPADWYDAGDLSHYKVIVERQEQPR